MDYMLSSKQQHEEPSNEYPSPSKLKLMRKSSLHYVRSRDELLVEQNEHFENLRRKIVKTRRTKIVGTVSQSICNYETLKKMVEAGLNSFTINMAYCTSDLLVSLRTHRDALEREFNTYLPITCVLKGTLVRIGALIQPEIFLRKGQEYRIVLNDKVLGTNLFCAVDDKEIIRRIKIGNQILIDYGQISMTIKRIEKSDESIKQLKEHFNYQCDDFLETIVEKKRRRYPSLFTGSHQTIGSDYESPASVLNDSTHSGAFISEEEEQRQIGRKFESNHGMNANTPGISSSESIDYFNNRTHFIHEDHKNQQDHSSSTERMHKDIHQQQQLNLSSFNQIRKIPQDAKYSTATQVNHSTSNRFADKLRQSKTGKKKTYDVIVCEVDSDCLLKAFKPIFIYQKDSFYLKREGLKKQYRDRASSNADEKTFVDSIGEQPSEDENYEAELEDEQIVTPKDITDIHTCLDNEIDCICVSNVRSARDLKTVKNIIGENNETGVCIMARIQTPEAVENFEEIVKASDGVQIARGYLTVHMPVEKLFAKQREMIHKCHEHLKPVFISCNILNSMVSSQLPTMCEVGEISSLVTDYVDDILLTSETSFGLHPVDSIKTLSRICVEAEALRIMKRMQNPSLANSVSIKSSKYSIPSCIIYCALEAAYSIQASIIVVFTSRGYTALKLSKLRPPCPVIAVTSNKKVARNLQQVSAVNSMMFDSLIGTEKLITKVIQKQKEIGLIKRGDFIVITSGDIEDKANQTNNLKIVTVQ